MKLYFRLNSVWCKVKLIFIAAKYSFNFENKIRVSMAITSQNYCVLVTQWSEQAPFTSEIMGLILTSDS